MNWVRLISAMGFVMALLGLGGCSAPALDTLTHAEPDNSRQRAMRRLNLASAYFEQGQTEVAQQEVRAALRIDPNYADAYSLLGLIHQRQQAPALAQPSFEQAMVLASLPSEPPSVLPTIQHNYGWFLCEQNQFSAAQAQFDRALAASGYRQADKTRHAQHLCMARANAHAAALLGKP